MLTGDAGQSLCSGGGKQVVEKYKKSHEKEMEYWRSRTRALKQQLDSTQNYLR